MAFWLDPLSATMTLIITFIGTLIHVYSIGYMRGDPGIWRVITSYSIHYTKLYERRSTRG